MAISTITPQNRTQTNLLAQALNGSSGSLAQALNSAIQRSTKDLKIQHQQGQNLVQEQARNLQREQEERFDLRNRAENAFDMQQTEQNNDVINAGRRQNQAYKEEDQKNTYTRIRELNQEERLFELAKMLSSEQPTQAALDNAKDLLMN